MLDAGSALVFMRVGAHAGEPLERIVERKRREVEENGTAFWGYGGTACHPRSVVQPFAEELAREGGIVRLCMEEVPEELETYWADERAATEWSIDGINFRPLPSSVEVRGSRYAFMISALRRERFELPLTRAVVAAGPSRGRAAARFLDHAGKPADKAVLRMVGSDLVEAEDGRPAAVSIDLVADLVRPYAVFLR